MQGHLEGMIGKPSGLIESLPKTLRNRLAYLGELQDTHDELAEKLHEEQVALQRKYEKLWGQSFTSFVLPCILAGCCAASSYILRCRQACL